MSELPTQVNFRCKGHQFCIDHPKEELLLVCKDCNETLVCIHCVSTTHVGHQLIAVNLLVQENFNFLQYWNIYTEETKIPRLSRRVEKLETAVKEIQQGIQVHIKKVQDHGEYLKELVEKSTTETVFELKEIEKKILQQFDKFKYDSDKAIKHLKALMKENTEVTKSDNILIVDVTKELNSLTTEEPEFECTFNNFKFNKGLDPESLVRAAFGSLEHDGNSQDLVTVKQDHANLSQNPTSSQLANISDRMRTVTRTKQGTLWFCEFDKPYLYRMDKNGSLEKHTLDVAVSDISLHLLNDQLYCISKNTICKVDTTTMTSTKMFRADVPVSMAVTHNGNILVKTSWKSKLTLYTCTGTPVQTVTNIPSKIQHISVCRATGNVALSCFDSGVSVLTDQLQTMFTYPTSGYKIDAWDATFDNGGRLLIADYYNKNVHIIDATTGQLQKIVPVENGSPVCLGATYSNNYVVVCTFHPAQMISIKYLD